MVLDAEIKQYFDRQFAGVIEHLGGRILALETSMGDQFQQLNARMDRVEQRIDKLEERVGKLEERFDRFELRTDERFESVIDQMRLMNRRLDGIDATLVDVRAEIATLNARVDGTERRVALIAERMRLLEKGYESLDGRLVVFADDVRQRFRVVNDRLAALAN